MSTESPFLGPHYTKTTFEHEERTEVTTSGASHNIKEAIDKTRGEDGTPDLTKLDPEVARLNKGAFNMLVGEEPEEYWARLQAIVGGDELSIVPATLAVLGENEARRMTRYAEYSPLGAALKDYFDTQDADDVKNEFSDTSPTESAGLSVKGALEAPVPEVGAVGSEKIDNIADKLNVLSGVLGSLDKYTVEIDQEGKILLTPKG